MTKPVPAMPATNGEAAVAAADRAAGKGDFAGAARILAGAAEASHDVETWLKLAAMRRASGDAAGALAAADRALACDPLDFVALLLRASLLDAMGADAVGEAYGRALAQMPAAVLPAHLSRGVARARDVHARHTEEQMRTLVDAIDAAASAGTPDERARLTRFASNAVRTTRVYHSEPTHYHYPGLVEREFHDRSAFPWLADLEAATGAIAAEFGRVAAAEHAELIPYIQYGAGVPLGQWAALNESRDWTAIHLLRNGRRVEANARHCASTLKLIDGLPQPGIAGHSPNAMFSLLAPGAHIPPHVGVANTRLVCHLPLVVPPGCWFRVGAERREWRRGEAFVFDDTIEHEARNEGDALRVVLIIDVWHPGLSPAERAGVAAAMAADGTNA